MTKSPWFALVFLIVSLLSYLQLTLTGLCQIPMTFFQEGMVVEDVESGKVVVNMTQDENPPPTIFHCDLKGNGMSEVVPTLGHIFDEYEYQALPPKRAGVWVQEDGEKTMRPYDIFIAPINVPCHAAVERWLFRSFAGKIVYISGESSHPPALHSLDRNSIVYMGPVSENYHSKALRLYYLQWVWWALFHSKGQDQLIHESLKPHNTGKNFLVYAANNCVRFRDAAFSALAEIAPAHHGGRCKGTDTHRNIIAVNTDVRLKSWWDNVLVYRDYKFCLVMEHIQQEGYVTEKILMAYQAGCIPIYYGPKSILDLFNNNSFVFYDVANPQPALDQVRYLHENETAYEEMLVNQPILADGNMTVAKYFSFSENVGGGRLKRQIRKLLGLDQYIFVK